MAELDRGQFVELLNRLGSEDDQVVLLAARELHGAVSEAGLTWNDLLHPGADGTVAPPAAIDRSGEVALHEDDDDLDDGDAEALSEAAELPVLPPDLSEDGRILERLLARKGLSKTMREELRDLRRSQAEGGLDAMDRRYIRALAKRLGA